MSIEAVKLGFAVLSVLMAGLIFGAARSVSRRHGVVTAVGLGIWLPFTAALAQSGALSHFDWMPPSLVRLLIPTGVATVVLGMSSWGTGIIRSLPLWVIVAAQSFRIPVEWLLHALYGAGGIPKQMTYEGWNFDLLTGLLALVVAWRIRRAPSNGLVLAWNVLGLGLLITIVTIANLSAPTSFRMFHEGPSSAIVATAPLVWLPAFLVPLALLGHVLVFRRLALEARTRSPAQSRAPDATGHMTAA